MRFVSVVPGPFRISRECDIETLVSLWTALFAFVVASFSFFITKLARAHTLRRLCLPALPEAAGT